MNVKINIKELEYVLEHTPAEQNIMLVGRHGIGKSEILNSYFEGKGMKVVSLFLGQMSDTGDLLGLPDKSGEITVFRPPYWFPIDGKPIVLFLDELNRARPEILQTIMDLALNKKLAGRSLPKGSRIIAAANEGEEYQLTDLDPALVSRFNIFQFEPDVDEWLSWAKKKDVDKRVMDFIRGNSQWLDKIPDKGDNFDMGLDKTPDRRGWKRVSDVIKPKKELDRADLKLISGIVGVKAAKLFESKLSQKKVIEAKNLLTDFDTQTLLFPKMKLHDYQILNEDIFEYMADSGNLTKKGDKINRNLVKYMDYLEQNSLREVLASFANLLNQKSNEQTYDYIAKNCSAVIKKAFSYISTIS